MSPMADWLYGIGPVEAALRAGRRQLRELILRSGGDSDRIHQLRDIAAANGVKVTDLERQEFERKLRGLNHQGVALDCGALPLLGFRELLDADPDGIVLALDQVEDPQNFGAMVRSAAFLGARGILVHRSKRAPLSAAVSKASAGALESSRLYECGNLADALQRLEKAGWRVVGSALDEQAQTVDQLRPGGPAILVMGNEGRGLRPLTLKRCTELVMIPRRGHAESLNVSVAAGIILARLAGPVERDAGY
ncbi:23S rRNA (guanosine(2251)-2'-O)-methyltransferase RlmB [bacterium]|nr:MAG: 23S rRNA (guanosine(2251)-2'-O)-methyltransferase RlmB [bacterium]RKZ15666.1 MAG: 23S rRNA (guanosine(2251)-2'-O)-methyltransferase RlmB [bacterium]